MDYSKLIGATLISSHNGFNREAIVTKITKTQIVCVSNGNTIRLRNNETSQKKWQEVGSTGHPRDEWRLIEIAAAIGAIETVVETVSTVSIDTPAIETVVETSISAKAELAAQLTPFLPESKRDLAVSIGIRPSSLSRVLNGEQMSFDTLEKLMSELGIAWSHAPFIRIWNAKNMLTLDVDAIFSHYHARKQDFTPVSAWQVWDVCIPTLDWRQADSAFETGGIEYRFVKHGSIRLLASLAPSGVFHLQVIE